MMMAGLALPAAGAPTDAKVEPGPGEVTLHACAGERCAFGRWKALGPLAARPAWDAPGQAAFTLAAGEPFDALDGVVVVETPGVVEVLRPVVISLIPHGKEGPAENLALEPGDRLEVLRPLGEGLMVLRHGTDLYEDAAFWEWRHKDKQTPLWMGNRPAAWWWVHVRNAKGQEGWIRLKVCYAWDPEIKECPASLVEGYSVPEGSGVR